MNGTKSSKKSSVGVVQPHGGMLIPGAGGGPQPGAGRPPSSFRKLCRKRFQRHLPKLDAMLERKRLRNSDLLAAMNLFARHAAGLNVPVEDVRAVLMEQTAVIREYLDEEQAEQLLQRIKPLWAKL